jgi:hypothetical protein
VARNHRKINKAIKKNGTNRKGKKITEVRSLTKIILPYSAKNNRVKLKEEYSVLNPDTSSLSPSAKSKGARLVSQSMARNQNINIPGANNPTNFHFESRARVLKLWLSIRGNNKRKTAETSYAIT